MIKKTKRIPWNKGLKGVQIPWNKGLTKDTSNSLMKTSLKMRGDKNPSKRKDVKKKIGNASIRNWKNKDFRKKQTKSHSKNSKETWKNPDIRERRILSLNNIYNGKNGKIRRKNISKINKKRYKEQPEKYENFIVSSKSKKTIEKRSNTLRNRYKNDVKFRDKMIRLRKSEKFRKLVSIKTAKAMQNPLVKLKCAKGGRNRTYTTSWNKNRPMTLEEKKVLSIKVKKTMNSKKWKNTIGLKRAKNISNSLKDKWKNDKNYRRIVINLMHMKPNKFESDVNKIIKHLNLKSLRYSGNGLRLISDEKNRYNPDFIDEIYRVIVECDGIYWHRNSSEKDILRVKTYNKKGYKVLVIKEDDFYKNPNIYNRRLVQIYN